MVTTAIILAVLVLLGLGIVINGLLRLREWLKNSPSIPNPDLPPEDTD